MVRTYDEISTVLKQKQQEYIALKILTNSDGTNREELEYQKHEIFTVVKVLKWVLGIRKTI